MPWHIDKDSNRIDFVVGGVKRLSYDIPRTQREIVKLLTDVAGTEVTKHEMTLLLILLGAVVQD